MYGLDLAETHKEAKTAAFLEFWESFELREDLIRQAGKRYFNPDPPRMQLNGIRSLHEGKEAYSRLLQREYIFYLQPSPFATYSPAASHSVLAFHETWD